ncbi:MAG: ATP-dependent DNA ligase [Euryarchaeota archaeon]|nr:ATP-dependent DNA ligase [Euryarchaeota archaeon]
MEFSRLCEVFERLDATPRRLEMMDILAGLFRETPAGEIDRVVYLLQGGISPPFEGAEIGLGEKFVAKAIARATGRSRAQVEKHYKTSGDLGLTAQGLAGGPRSRLTEPEPLTVASVFETFTRMAATGGTGSQDVKIGLLTELLTAATPVEAKYIARVPIGKLRLGAGDATILEALSACQVGDKSLKESLERAYNLCSDLGLVARTLLESPGKIGRFTPRVGSPIRPALAERLPGPEEIIGKMGPCLAEAKYDGFRIQVHKRGERVELFSRRLEKTTPMFPEIVEGARRQIAGDAILEGEALSYDEATGAHLPFQETIQRKRKHGVAQAARDLPLRLFAFDLLYHQGEDLTRVPYGERRARLENALRQGETLQMAEARHVSTPRELEDYFHHCIEAGLEGIIAKDLRAPYVAGARKFAWIKLKRSYRGELADTLDLAIVGYFKGRGQRAQFGMGTVLGAVWDPKTETFKTVAKVGSGLTEADMTEFKKKLDAITLRARPRNVDSLVEPDAWVTPRYVIEVAADEITRSPSHTCGRTPTEPGYALRFPRLTGDIRGDKGAEEATTVQEVLKMYSMQKRMEPGGKKP